jgi:hypothetical protein
MSIPAAGTKGIYWSESFPRGNRPCTSDGVSWLDDATGHALIWDKASGRYLLPAVSLTDFEV